MSRNPEDPGCQDPPVKAVVILVRTHSPGNLGAAARCVKNFGASLLLVSPSADRAHGDARAFASGAEDVLEGAAISEDWDGVAAKADLFVALSSLRSRGVRGLPPETTFAALAQELEGGRRVGLVFGSERSGLTTEEVLRCGARLRLPSVPSFPTLNLAQSVAASLAILAERKSSPGEPPLEAPEDRNAPRVRMSPPAPAVLLERFLRALREAMAASGYEKRLSSNAHVDSLDELASLFKRAHPTTREVSLLLGALAALTKAPGTRGTAIGEKLPSLRGSRRAPRRAPIR